MAARHDTRAPDGPGNDPAAPGRPPGPRWSLWWRGRSIRTRLLSIVAVPMALLVVLAGLGALYQLGVAGRADRAVAGVRLVMTTQDLIHELQRERGLTNGLLGGQVGYRDDVTVQRGRVDDARRALDEVLGAVDPALATATSEALESVQHLPDVRAVVDGGTAIRSRTFDHYTSAIDQLADASARAASAGVIDLRLRENLDALRTLGEAKEYRAIENGLLIGVLSAGSFKPGEYLRLVDSRAAGTVAFAGLDADATDPQRELVEAALSSPAANSARVMEQRVIDGGDAPALDVPATQWWDAMTTLVDDLQRVQQQIGADADLRADDLRGTAQRSLAMLLVLTALVLGAAVALVVVVARSITRPLQDLAETARRVAQSGLPDAIARVQSGEDDQAPAGDAAATRQPAEHRADEIGEVVRALDQVEFTAIDLARQQARLRRNAAESFSSLARRNQNLLRRQLGFITDLERREQEPASLANLFELDHLATRMRRNAESLLVLVGERSQRRWSQPVPASDILRAALAEVEDYRRVVLRRVDEVAIVGRASADLAHLLAELIENALSFSPPDREVEIYSQYAGQGYTIAVVDHGVGLAEVELARANARLRGEEEYLVAPTKFLGHYVVGRLARKLGVLVRLHESALSGVTAQVTLPQELIGAPRVTGGQVAPAQPDQRPRFATPVEQTLPVEGVGSAGPPFRLDRRAGSVDAPPRSDVPALPAAPIAVLDASPDPGPVEHEPAAPPRTRNGLPKRVRAAAETAPAAERRPHTDVPAQRRSIQAFAEFRSGYSQNRAGQDARRHDAGHHDEPPATGSTP